MTSQLQIQAHAKLNLYLEVFAKRPDGYHELESHVVFLELADTLTFEPADDLQIAGAEITENIILKAARKLQQEFGISKGAKIHLQKIIPMAAGLGGGSADAAATIFGLQKFWGFECNAEKLYSIAAEIGADVPCCLYGLLEQKNSVKFSGIGEKLSEKSAPQNLHFVLVNPQKQLATKDVFSEIREYSSPQKSDDFLLRKNDMEVAAEKLMPEISEILAALAAQKNCQLSRMSGSGATCFGIFANELEAKSAEEKLKTNFPNYWVQYTNLK